MSLTIPQLEDDVSTLAAVLAYAAAGWYVLPVSPRDKKNPGTAVVLLSCRRVTAAPDGGITGMLVATICGAAGLTLLAIWLQDRGR